MAWTFPRRRVCLQLISAMILIVGLGSAAWIYLRADNQAEDILGYEEAGGTRYPIRPEDSKEYLRSLELYGGKANVLADKLRRAFFGLWQGKSLAGIVGLSSIILSWGCYRAAQQPPEQLESEGPSRNMGRRD